ncbi:MAG: UDP-N-acetylmuramoyl-L-alanyl-D-glutamate--2,6-diaminopimelate ligase [Bacteroidetes bacterium]|jgi:UDP-N-acetylmuramoyl-L-alanyl-D-glutamate--2,6-diaminopimelate ligase|nr:UDP-N-acetylmuramoyl-L-alanyl-D-glutamate--2,6-diaminopimelate ligase [Bacteroidota bacterium]
MRLGELMRDVTVRKMFQTVFGRMVVTHEVEVNRVQYDSRRVERGDLFVAISGSASDGHRFLSSAIAQGAKVVVVERDDAISDPECMHTGVAKLVVPDSRVALAQMAANYYGRPAAAMTIVGITGTNGKTTTSTIMRSVLETAGRRCGLIGTIEVRFGTTTEPATHTTPESLELQQAFARMRDEQCLAVSMEVSSHALQQSRVHGVPFAAGVFTNLTQDHLDYHGTMESYFAAKKILFDGLEASAAAVVHADDPWSGRITADTKARVYRFGRSIDAQLRLRNATTSIDGSVLELEDERGRFTVRTPLVGQFNVENALAATAAGLAIGLPREQVIAGVMAADRVRGRFERIASKRGWTAIVDYAHTPDALEKCLAAARSLMTPENGGRLFVVFGAGGDRDRTKRPQMGAVAAKLADVIVVTSDNPRTEDPERIIDEISAGFPAGHTAHRDADRKAAIGWAASQAGPGDVILVAGKGHEDYQVIGREKHHFSDREEVEAVA